MPNANPKDETNRSTSIQGTEVPIDPQTNRPQAGAIVGGPTGARKILWTERDILDKYPMVEWYNQGDLRQIIFNGVRWSFSGGDITTPSIIRDLVKDYYRNQGVMERRLAQDGVVVTVGQLEPLPRQR